MFGKVRVMIRTGTPIMIWEGSRPTSLCRVNLYPVVIGRR